jgi:hypothetical protein
MGFNAARGYPGQGDLRIGLEEAATAAPTNLGHPANAHASPDWMAAGGAAAGVAGLCVDHGSQVVEARSRPPTSAPTVPPLCLLHLVKHAGEDQKAKATPHDDVRDLDLPPEAGHLP